MTIQNRDMIFTFEESCNCCCWSWKRPIKADDPVYVTPRGQVKKFDYSKAGDGAPQQVLNNIEQLLARMAESQNQLQAVLLAIQHQLNLNIQGDVRLLSAREVRRIEQIALPILRAPSPEPREPPPTPSLQIRTEEDRPAPTVKDDYFGAIPSGIGGVTPKRQQSNLVRSPEMRDLRLDDDHSEAEYEVLDKRE